MPKLHNRTFFEFLALGIPVILGAGFLLAAWSLQAQLPEQIALHWNAKGEVDGTGEPWIFVLVISCLAIGVTVLLALIQLISPKSWFTKLAVLRLFWLMGITGITLGFSASLFSQLGISDPMQVPAWPTLVSILGAFALGFGLFLIGQLQVAKLAPKTNHQIANKSTIPLTDTERISWGRSINPPWFLLLLVVALSLVTVLPLLQINLILGLVVFAVMAITSTLLFWKIKLNDSEVVIRTTLGWPSYRFQISELSSASTEKLKAFKDFGGWGIRTRLDGSWGVIVNGETALALHRDNSPTVLVTTKDAQLAAGLINGLIERRTTNLLPGKYSSKTKETKES